MPKYRLPPTHFPEVFQHDESHTLFDDFTMRAARQVHRNTPGLPAYQRVPLRNNPMWSGNNEFGFQVAFAPDANNRQMVLKMGEIELPQVWSVMLAMDLPPDANIPVGGFSVSAEVQAGSGGTVDTFEVDWNQGTSFSTIANALVINAVYTNTINIPSGLILRAIVGERPLLGNAASVTLTASSLALGGAVTKIPKYAREVQVLNAGGVAGDPYAADTSYSFLTGPGTTGFAFISGTNLKAFGGKIAIPGGANFMGSGSVSNDLNVNLRFALGL